jgi:hypothetical protein
MATKTKTPTPAKPVKIRIDDDVISILRGLTYEGRNCKITTQLDRKTYERVNKVLEAMGGKWNRGQKAHLFEGDAREIMEDTIQFGEYVDAKKTYQFFETPTETAMMLVGKAVAYFHKHNLQIDELRAMEPSAGHGRIAEQLLFAGFYTYMVELNHACVEKLDVLAQKYPEKSMVIEGDALTALRPDLHPAIAAIIMNPPFSGLQDIDHVTRALEFLAPKKGKHPGGILIAIMSPAWTYRTDKKAEAFRKLVEKRNGDWSMLPDGTFSASGTEVRTGVLTITGR